MQTLLADLEKLDKASDSLPAEQVAANVEQRIVDLDKLAKIAPAANRDQWYRQMIDILSIAIQSGNYPKGTEALSCFKNS